MPIPALIALGVVAAAAIAGSQISAAEEEKRAKRDAKRQKSQAEKDALMQYWQQRANEAARESGFATMNNAGTELRNKQARDAGYNAMLQDAADRAGTTRTLGYIQAGSTIAGGIAGGAFSGLGSAAGSAASGLTADQMANAASSYVLDAGQSMLLSEPGQYRQPTKLPLAFDDGSGGWELPSSLSGNYDGTPQYQRKLGLYR